MKKVVTLALLALFITGCASDDAVKSAAQADFDTAKKKLEKGHYGEVALTLQDFTTKHPYSKYATQAELLRLFAAYKGGEFILSEVLSKDFVERHPRHPDVDYAKYMLAMSHYRQSSPSERDQEQTIGAIKGFKRLLKEHPESSYAKDGANRLQRLYKRLAGHELNVGKFYFDKGRYVAAANRFQVILEKYQTTDAIEEGLYWLAASFDRLGITENARQTAIILKHTYPNSDWSRKAARFL
ncbi:MAG: outer membrane protein assembly factor BamD [Mariprofundaceae bacterium]|nr:outer membrane protein assembly factor BamD [Mariprofundaceae bacterium]